MLGLTLAFMLGALVCLGLGALALLLGRAGDAAEIVVYRAAPLLALACCAFALYLALDWPPPPP